MPVVLVVSDSHGHTARLNAIARAAGSFDYLVHCGDGVRDLESLVLPRGTVVVRVCGNVDRCQVYGMDHQVIEEIGGRRFMVTHGDRYDAGRDLDHLLAAAEEAGVDAVFFGHTHLPLYRPGRPALFNPGPAQKGCYGIAEIGDSVRCRLERVLD